MFPPGLGFLSNSHRYLDQEDPDEPYLAGIKYNAIPPLKRFRDMEHLSGGEKTMAALALLFAVHGYQPSPFFVLDEVDAALDNANVARLVRYIKEYAGPGMQFIVISLKPGFFEGSETLVGVMRDQAVNSSKTLTLDVSSYPNRTPTIANDTTAAQIQCRVILFPQPVMYVLRMTNRSVHLGPRRTIIPRLHAELKSFNHPFVLSYLKLATPAFATCTS